MTTSKSNTSKSSFVILLAILLVGVSTVAFADAAKKKIVVLDFKGPDGDKFRDEIVKLIEKDSKVVNTEKWTGAAEEADAKKFNTENVKKVAHKVKVDGVVWGKVEKDGDGYTLKLKLRAGKNGEQVGDELEVKADSAELNKKGKKKVRKDLLPAIDTLEPFGGSSEDKPPDVVVKDPDKTEKVDKTDKTEKTSDEGGHHHHKKHTEATEDGGDGSKTEVSVEEPAHTLTPDEALLPANRAVDFTIGMSFVARHLSFTADSDLADQPSGYKQTIPVAGGVMDATVYPMAFNHKNSGLITGLGLEVMYDKVIRINSQKKYVDASMMQATANLATVEDRFSIGAVLRYPVSPALLIGGKVMYSSQQFNIAQTFATNMITDVPNVHYSMAEPKVFLKYSLGGAIIIDVDAGFMLVTNTGGIQASNTTGYGPATVTGYEASAGIDYTLTKNLFVRALARFETVNLSFKGDPKSLANTRDGDPDQDVKGAKDLYYGGVASIGYAF
jgi:hypothetical protein